MYYRARQAGMTVSRATVASFVASFRDCWAFRKRIASLLGLSVRTVQRALTEAQDRGLIRCARAKVGEVPPGARGPVDCGFSHRWTIGWGVAGKRAAEKIRAAVERARMRRVLRVVTPAASATERRSPMEPKPLTAFQKRVPTLEELNAELARIERERGERGS